MEHSEKKLAGLGTILNGGKEKEIAERIRLLRSEEPFGGALKLIALYYDQTDNQHIRQIISDLFNDLKEKSARAEVIESVTMVRKQDTRAMLISSCWQSGLDYSEFAKPLAEQFITGDYMTSLECFTVLDTCAGSISHSERDEIVLLLRTDIESFDIPKKKLALELISMLKG
ncbi:MAG: hypothetical protein MUE37_09290 [Bacteroidales bacterium]|jgi:hypothetical protein|nr:hypothetical protein [Bacteroidales bacterium]